MAYCHLNINAITGFMTRIKKLRLVFDKPKRFIHEKKPCCSKQYLKMNGELKHHALVAPLCLLYCLSRSHINFPCISTTSSHAWEDEE